MKNLARSLADKRCGSGFWGAATSSRVLVCGTGFPLTTHISAYTAHQSGLVLWYCLEWPWKAGNYLGTGTGIVFVLLGRRMLDGKPGVSGRGTSPGSVFHRVERTKAGIFCLRNQHKWETMRACSVGKPTKGYRCHTERNLTLNGGLSYT